MKKKLLIIFILTFFGFLLVFVLWNFWFIGLDKIDDEIRARILIYSNKEAEVDMKIIDQLFNNSGVTNPVLDTNNTKRGRIYTLMSGSFSDGPVLYYNYQGDFIASCNGATSPLYQLPFCRLKFGSIDAKKSQHFESLESKKYWCQLLRYKGDPDSEECLEILGPKE